MTEKEAKFAEALKEYLEIKEPFLKFLNKAISITTSSYLASYLIVCISKIERFDLIIDIYFWKDRLGNYRIDDACKYTGKELELTFYYKDLIRQYKGLAKKYKKEHENEKN